MNNVDSKIEKFADLILNSHNIVALTGAGMSTESGIPDFRSPGTGLWTKVDPMEFASINSYVAKGTSNLDSMFEMGKTIFSARANKGHKALSKMQKLGKLVGVLTQNVDSLHQKAKTENIVELHGNVREAVCMRCKEIFPIVVMVNQYLKERREPSCEECNGLLKPNAIFFGEPLDSEVLEKADKMIAECDLLVILGSSLVVYPVAFYPHKALSVGAKLAIINIQETEMDDKSEIVIHEKIGETLPKIIEIVERELKEN